MARRVVLCLCIFIALSAAKDRKWQAGKIIDNKAAEADLGNVYPVSHGRSYDFSPREGLQTHGRSWIAIPAYGVRETYVIEADNSKQVIATRILRSDNPSEFSKMQEVRFAVVKGSVFMLDPKGREHKFEIVKRKTGN